jgi:hypothetical protein
MFRARRFLREWTKVERDEQLAHESKKRTILARLYSTRLKRFIDRHFLRKENG